MIDRDAFSIFPGYADWARSWTIEPDDVDDVRVRENQDFREALEDALGLDAVRFVTTGGDRYEVSRQQWDDGNNFLALAPGVVSR